MARLRRSLAGIIPYLIVFTVLILFVGCVAPKKRSTDSNGDNGAPVVNPGESGPYAAMFPHPDGWSNPALHGVWVSQNGSYDPCLKCHKKISGKSETIPACSTCHSLYPHQVDWVKKEAHGKALLVNGRSACATQCHGYDLKGGLSGISCSLCHTTYPHPSTWVVPSEHGEVAKGDGKSLCMGCHGADLKGGSSEVSCYLCHTDYPHASDWAEQEKHGAHVLDVGKSSCMTNCHGFDLKGGLSGVGCDSCHNLYPHSSTWENDHQALTLALGKDVCKGCHGDDFKRVLDGQNCYSCHADFPHPETTWLVYEGGHGERVKVTYGGSTTPCQGCHGVDLKEIKDGNNCFSCHPSFPHQDPSGFEWKDYEGHGEYTLLNNKSECASCHGDNYQGERGNTSCFTCHVSYPHLDGWRRDPGQVQDHGNYAQTNGTTTCATARCHGVGLIPAPGTTKGPGCMSCHASYPHPAGWNSGYNHGPVAKLDIDVCKTCHGSGLDVAPQGYQTCKDCHPSYLRHQTAELGFPGWFLYTGHGKYVMDPPNNGDMTECQLCHGTDYLGGLSMVSCKSCHKSFPHNTPNWADRIGHGDYVHTTLGDDLTDCKICHGNDLMGGNSGVSCASCHPGYPHASNWDQGTGHGVYFSSTYDSFSTTACFGCHGEPIAFTDTPPQTKVSLEAQSDCYSCHWSYPHIGYDVPNLGLKDWDEVWGHYYYLIRSALAADSLGYHPTTADDPRWIFSVAPGVIPVLQNTCGGSTTNNCHFNGYRSIPSSSGSDSNLCGQYCHK